MSNKIERKNAEISARVDSLIKDAGETANSFAKTLGYPRAQTIYDIVNGKAAPSYDFFNKFALSEFSAKYNLHWLLTGQGDMNRKEQPTQEPTQIVAHERDPRDVELIATLKGMVETQKDLIVELKREKSAEGLGSGQRSAQTATYSYAGPQSALK